MYQSWHVAGVLNWSEAPRRNFDLDEDVKALYWVLVDGRWSARFSAYLVSMPRKHFDRPDRYSMKQSKAEPVGPLLVGVHWLTRPEDTLGRLSLR